MLVLPPPPPYSEEFAIRITLDLAVCKDCRALIGPNDLVTDPGWAQIEQACADRGKAVPERSQARLEWELWQ